LRSEHIGSTIRSKIRRRNWRVIKLVRLLLIIFGLFRIIVKRKRSIIKWKRRKTKRRFKWRRKRGRVDILEMVSADRAVFVLSQ
jgi:hypothetical protein